MRSASSIEMAEAHRKITARLFDGSEKLPTKAWRRCSASLLIVTNSGKEHLKILKQHSVGTRRLQNKGTSLLKTMSAFATSKD